MKRILLSFIFISGLIANPLVVSAEECWDSFNRITSTIDEQALAEQGLGNLDGWNFSLSESGDVCGNTYTYEFSSIADLNNHHSLVESRQSVNGELIVHFKIESSSSGGVVTQIIATQQDYDRLWNLLGLDITPTATVLEVTGQTFSLTSIATQAPTASDTIPDIGALLTLKDSSIKIQRNDGTIIASKEKTVTVLSPAVESNNSIALVRGEVTSTVDCTNTGDYEVRTIAADIKVSASCSRAAGTTSEFTTKYGQSGANGTLTVSVASGTVEMTDRNNKTFTLTAGQEKTIQYRVPRTDWVLPVDGDKLYGGETNLLIWKEYPNASSYQMEFNLPTPLFAEQNASRPQYQKQVIPLPAGSYAKVDGDLIAFNLPLPKGFSGLVLELRIFALDAAANIIGESVASDSSTITVTD
ncbi:MAG: FecR family protein [gamma proteobacterium symbiont of Taylorina sp.]|nr:FecR family protein [gamma proteobacterium symbiont of Taylorina sp.]